MIFWCYSEVRVHDLICDSVPFWMWQNIIPGGYEGIPAGSHWLSTQDYVKHCTSVSFCLYCFSHWRQRPPFWAGLSPPGSIYQMASSSEPNLSAAIKRATSAPVFAHAQNPWLKASCWGRPVANKSLCAQTQLSLLSPSAVSEESLLLLGDEQFLFMEVQSSEQMLCRSWEKLAEEEKSLPHGSGRVGLAGPPDHVWRAPASNNTGPSWANYKQSPFYSLIDGKKALQWVSSAMDLLVQSSVLESVGEHRLWFSLKSLENPCYCAHGLFHFNLGSISQ